MRGEEGEQANFFSWQKKKTDSGVVNDGSLKKLLFLVRVIYPELKNRVEKKLKAEEIEFPCASGNATIIR